ncbi:MAG TPA: ProQ/FinO family protein, partial [Legionella sp.]|nr:ProQ/FinO family protein [Legionella sp.]
IRINPLKMGIMDDILEHADKALEAGISRSKLREAVVLFTRRLDYLACLKAREMRVDLAGNPVEAVSEQDAENAAAKIKKRVEKSVRNARKIMAEKSSGFSNATHSTSSYSARHTHHPAATSTSSTDDYLPTYPPRAPAFQAQNAPAQPARSASVIVKHKTTRQFDPYAVARLKEKLGLSRSEKKETTE